MEVATSVPAERVIRFLERVIWCSGNRIKIKYIQPSKPTQNCFIEHFNGSYRRGILDTYLFDNLSQVRELTQHWMKDYNELRPHEALWRFITNCLP